MDFEALSLALEFNTMMENDELIYIDIYINDDEVVENRECFFVVIDVSRYDSAIEVDRGMARVCTNNDDGMVLSVWIITRERISLLRLALFCSCDY